MGRIIDPAAETNQKQTSEEATTTLSKSFIQQTKIALAIDVRGIVRTPLTARLQVKATVVTQDNQTNTVRWRHQKTKARVFRIWVNRPGITQLVRTGISKEGGLEKNNIH